MTAMPARTGTALVLIAAVMVAACQTARLDNIVPQSAAPLPPPSPAQRASTAAAPADAGENQPPDGTAAASASRSIFEAVQIARPRANGTLDVIVFDAFPLITGTG